MAITHCVGYVFFFLNSLIGTSIQRYLIFQVSATRLNSDSTRLWEAILSLAPYTNAAHVHLRCTYPYAPQFSTGGTKDESAGAISYKSMGLLVWISGTEVRMCSRYRLDVGV